MSSDLLHAAAMLRIEDMHAEAERERIASQVALGKPPGRWPPRLADFAAGVGIVAAAAALSRAW
jgi:hypothetical protein